MKTESFFTGFIQRVVVFSGCLQQGVSPHDIGLDEFARPVDRAVHMAFRRQMHNMCRLEIRKDPVQCRLVADVRFFKTETRIAGNLGQGFQVPRICELIYNAYCIVGVVDYFPNYSRTNKTGTAGYDHFVTHVISQKSQTQTSFFYVIL